MIDKQQISHRDIAGNVYDISSLIDYQEGAVISKTLIDKKSGTVTLFSFDKGEGLSEHTAPFDALVLVFDGEADITIAGEVRRVKKDQMIVMPANKPHSLRAAEQFKMALILIKE